MNSATQRTRGYRQFTIGMLVYASIVMLEGFLVEPDSLPLTLSVVFALLPMVAAIWAMLGWLNAIRTFDEMQQKIFAEAGLLSLGITVVVTFTYGFLEIYLGFPRVSMFAVWPVIAFSYLITLPATRRRYQ